MHFENVYPQASLPRSIPKFSFTSNSIAFLSLITGVFLVPCSEETGDVDVEARRELGKSFGTTVLCWDSKQWPLEKIRGWLQDIGGESRTKDRSLKHAPSIKLKHCIFGLMYSFSNEPSFLSEFSSYHSLILCYLCLTLHTHEILHITKIMLLPIFWFIIFIISSKFNHGT